MTIDWINEAKRHFRMTKPRHFTNYNHCEECAEHDQTLINCSIDTIGLEELGNPGWDPLCFCSAEGKKYYMPALIRLCLETIDDQFYFEQFLFHLESDGVDNSLFMSCDDAQRRLISSFIEQMVGYFAEQIDNNYATDDVLRVFEIWSR
ncbi:MAG: hypothetical protein V7752_11805 [Halopseudomonas sp.]